jgi:hypothetical protein
MCISNYFAHQLCNSYFQVILLDELTFELKIMFVVPALQYTLMSLDISRANVNRVSRREFFCLAEYVA